MCIWPGRTTEKVFLGLMTLNIGCPRKKKLWKLFWLYFEIYFRAKQFKTLFVHWAINSSCGSHPSTISVWYVCGIVKELSLPKFTEKAFLYNQQLRLISLCCQSPSAFLLLNREDKCQYSAWSAFKNGRKSLEHKLIGAGFISRNHGQRICKAIRLILT